MSTAQARLSAEEMVDEARRMGGKVYSGMDWNAYQAFQEELGEQRVPLTYDQGKLEILMPVSRTHEDWLDLIGLFITVFCEETNTNWEPGGGMTLEKEEVDSAVQGDNCYWIANAAKIRGIGQVDLTIHPPPDLFVEIEISRTVLSRVKVLAALKVPEVWRFNGKALKVGLLQTNGEYRWGEKSLAFPGLPIAELARLLRESRGMERLAILRSFRTWVREQMDGR